MKLIENSKELELALTRLDELTVAFSNGDKSVKNEMDVLSLIVEDYENKEWKIELLPPNEFLTVFLNETGRTQQDLAKVLGAQSRASDVLTGKRELSKAQIIRLTEQWGLPPASLLGVKLSKAA